MYHLYKKFLGSPDKMCSYWRVLHSALCTVGHLTRKQFPFPNTCACAMKDYIRMDTLLFVLSVIIYIRSRTSLSRAASLGEGHTRYGLHLSSFVSTGCILYCTQITVLLCDFIYSIYITRFIVLIYLSYSMQSQIFYVQIECINKENYSV